jgi:hypothetical protein
METGLSGNEPFYLAVPLGISGYLGRSPYVATIVVLLLIIAIVLIVIMSGVLGNEGFSGPTMPLMRNQERDNMEGKRMGPTDPYGYIQNYVAPPGDNPIQVSGTCSSWVGPGRWTDDAKMEANAFGHRKLAGTVENMSDDKLAKSMKGM